MFIGTTDGDGGFDAAEMDRELIASRLKQDVMEHSGKVHKFIADSVNNPPAPFKALHLLNSFNS